MTCISWLVSQRRRHISDFILLFFCVLFSSARSSFSHLDLLSLSMNMCASGKVDEDTQVQLQAWDLDWRATCNKTPHITKQGAAVYDYVVTQPICLQMVWQCLLQNIRFSSPTPFCHDLLKYSSVLRLFLIGTWHGTWGENTHVAVNKVMKWWSQHWKTAIPKND